MAWVMVIAIVMESLGNLFLTFGLDFLHLDNSEFVCQVMDVKSRWLPDMAV